MAILFSPVHSVSPSTSALLKVFMGEKLSPPPVWMMRQAGRYLPEYRELRSRSPSFMDFCYTPELTIEATLQPIRRFGLDAAIIFSDILVIPHALGQAVSFIENEGPRLDPVIDGTNLNILSSRLDLEKLEPVFIALREVRAALPTDVALLGFCGAPWTLASYMIAGKSTPDQAPARLLAYRQPEFMAQLISLLVEACIDYLEAQIIAGADAVQIFDSFAGALPPALFQQLSLEPIRAIVSGLRARQPDARIIVFAKGAGRLVRDFSGFSNVIGLDWQTDMALLDEWLDPAVPVQGNLDPLALLAGGTALNDGVQTLLSACRNRPHIFNLGHGILPPTPIEHVETMLSLIREHQF